MSRGFPSMAALLALIAVAGYQHRDKIAELIQGRGPQNAQVRGQRNDSGGLSGGLDGLLGSLRGALGGGGGGGFLNDGLRELVDRFKQNGRGDVADSWVSRGPNKPIAPHELESAIGPDELTELSQRTGLSREELLSRLSRELPSAVDKYTPDGRLPA